jgi:hypothetical protein
MDGIGVTCSTHEEEDIDTKLYYKDLPGRDYWRKLRTHRRIILKWIV